MQIITAAPALSPIEAEQYVTIPVERAMAGVPRVTETRSISKYGLSVVTVVFTDDTDIYFARQLVNERMREAEQAVSSQYGKPEMGPITSGLGEVFQFTVENDQLSLMAREELLDWYVGPALRTVPGVVEVLLVAYYVYHTLATGLFYQYFQEFFCPGNRLPAVEKFGLLPS